MVNPKLTCMPKDSWILRLPPQSPTARFFRRGVTHFSLSLKRDHADNGAGVGVGAGVDVDVGAGVGVGVDVGAGIGVDVGADNGVDSSLPFQRNVTCQHFLSTFFLLLSFFKKN